MIAHQPWAGWTGQVQGKKQILVVDDDAATLQMMHDFLTESGFTVTGASTAQQAQERILQQRPDLIVLDLFLPDMKGSDFCSHLRQNASTRDIPVILCTAKSVTVSEKIKGFQAGVDDYLIRPFEMAELLARIHALLRRAQSRPREDVLARIQSLVRPPAPAPATPAAPAIAVASAAVAPRLSVPATEERRPKSSGNLLARLRSVFSDPAAAARPHPREDLLLTWILVLATPLVASFGSLFAHPSDFDGWIGAVSLGIVSNLLMWIASAGAVHLAAPFEGLTLSMKQCLIFAGLSWTPRLIGALLSAVYGLAAGLGLAIGDGHFSAGVDLIPGLGTYAIVRFVGQIGVFDIWAAFMIVMAVRGAAAPNEKPSQKFTWFLGLVCSLLGALTAY